ncbi:MAG: dephospho-CoA kinase [Candidatus Marinimicrobia bacterium]|nr:dephospho-CoA kinase [Candidatus Neomarinimicrobiota bacterium]
MTVLRIGITGGLGSGKSILAKYFGERGAHVFDADREAKLILLRSESVYRTVIASFGDHILNKAGELDFRRLAEYAFAKPERQQRLNDIIHPEVVQAADRQMITASRQGVALFVLDAALLFEAQLEQYLDVTIVVVADEELRVKRALERGTLMEEDIRKRIRLQMPDSEKIARADFVITNDGTEDEFQKQFEALHNNLTSESSSLP